MTERKELYIPVTDRIIAVLERGIRTWMKPWQREEFNAG